MIFSLIHDFAAALAAMPEGHPRRRILALLDEAIRRDVQFISRHPTTLFQCLWNSCWWYDCPEVAGHYTTGEGSPSIGLHRLQERWRERRTVGAGWLRSLRPPAVPLGAAQISVLAGHSQEVSPSYAISPSAS